MVVRTLLVGIDPDLQILEAADGAEADRQLQKTGIDVALIDFNMPGEDGLEVAARVRSRGPDIAIAIVSANAQRDIVNRARALKAAFLEKPLSAETLAGFFAATDLQRSRSA